MFFFMWNHVTRVPNCFIGTVFWINLCLTELEDIVFIVHLHFIQHPKLFWTVSTFVSVEILNTVRLHFFLPFILVTESKVAEQLRQKAKPLFRDDHCVRLLGYATIANIQPTVITSQQQFAVRGTHHFLIPHPGQHQPTHQPTPL